MMKVHNYSNVVDYLVNWCDENDLRVNVNKTKEIIFDFRKKKEYLTPLKICDKAIDVCTEHKYLGVWFENKLNWNTNTTKMCSKANQRLYFLRKLRSYNVGRDTLLPEHNSICNYLLLHCMVLCHYQERILIN